MREQKEEGGEALHFVHYCARPWSGETGCLSWPLRCLCSVLFLFSESSRSPGSLSLSLSRSLSLSLFLSRRPSWFSLSRRLLRLLPPRPSPFLLPPGNKRGKRSAPLFPIQHSELNQIPVKSDKLGNSCGMNGAITDMVL